MSNKNTTKNQKAENKEQSKSPAEVPSIVPDLNVELDESEINAGLIVSVEEMQKKAAEEKAKREKEKAERAKNPQPTSNRLKVQPIFNDTPLGWQALHDYDKAPELKVHDRNAEGKIHELCWSHYGEECPTCKIEIKGYNGEPTRCYAKPMKIFISYIFNNVGQVFTTTNNKGETKNYNIKPIKALEVPMGKDRANILALHEAHRMKYFKNRIWLIDKKYGSKMDPVKGIDEEDFRSLIGREVDLTLPEEALRINELSKTQILKAILSTFDNVQWEKLGFQAPKQSVVRDPDTEAKQATDSVGNDF